MFKTFSISKKSRADHRISGRITGYLGRKQNFWNLHVLCYGGDRNKKRKKLLWCLIPLHWYLLLNVLIKLDLPCRVMKKGLVKIGPFRVGAQCRLMELRFFECCSPFSGISISKISGPVPERKYFPSKPAPEVDPNSKLWPHQQPGFKPATPGWYPGSGWSIIRKIIGRKLIYCFFSMASKTDYYPLVRNGSKPDWKLCTDNFLRKAVYNTRLGIKSPLRL